MKRVLAYYYLFLLAGTAIFAAMIIFVGSTVLYQTGQVHKLQVQEKNLQFKEKQLRLDLAEKEQAQVLAEFSLKNGFAKIDDVYYLDTNTALAAR